MLQFDAWKKAVVAVTILFGVLYAAPNILGSGGGASFLPGSPINLGLDLQGGSHLLLRVDIEEVERAVNIIQDQNPDLIVFTGDWINSHAEELQPYVHIFKQLKAPFGKYAVWGNHDYGRGRSNQDNIEILRGLVNDAGFQVLENENITIEIQREGSLHSSQAT